MVTFCAHTGIGMLLLFVSPVTSLRFGPATPTRQPAAATRVSYARRVLASADGERDAPRLSSPRPNIKDPADAYVDRAMARVAARDASRKGVVESVGGSMQSKQEMSVHEGQVNGSLQVEEKDNIQEASMAVNSAEEDEIQAQMLRAEAEAERQQAEAEAAWKGAVQDAGTKLTESLNAVCNTLINYVADAASGALSSLKKACDNAVLAARARVLEAFDELRSVPMRLRLAAIAKAEETKASILGKAEETKASILSKVEETKATILATPQRMQISALEAAEDLKEELSGVPAALAEQAKRAMLSAVVAADAKRKETRYKRDKLKELIALQQELAEVRRARMQMEKA
mmetsp:Transcript_32526/g.68174  ORF Transcript_32526/g.68174 Transcript_32526/m.68174 type:complete len:346 (-) Transcript_32526:207-1244(-)